MNEDEIMDAVDHRWDYYSDLYVSIKPHAGFVPQKPHRDKGVQELEEGDLELIFGRDCEDEGFDNQRSGIDHSEQVEHPCGTGGMEDDDWIMVSHEHLPVIEYWLFTQANRSTPY